METEATTARNPRILLWSSGNLRKTRQRLETNARGPPNKRTSVRKSMFAQGREVRNGCINRPTSAEDFQLPIPPATKPTMEEAFRMGLRSSQFVLCSNKEPCSYGPGPNIRLAHFLTFIKRKQSLRVERSYWPSFS